MTDLHAAETAHDHARAAFDAALGEQMDANLAGAFAEDAARDASDKLTAARATVAALADRSAAGDDPDPSEIAAAMSAMAAAETQALWRRFVVEAAERRLNSATAAVREADVAATVAADALEKAQRNDRVRELAAAARARVAA